MSFFEIDDVPVPLQSVVDFTQSYEAFGSSVIHRMMNGDGKEQSNWTKIKTTLSGRGWIPAGLDGIGSGSVELKCAAHKTLGSVSNVIVLPAERRSDTDYEPRGYAIVGADRIDTSINISVNTATLGVVSGATGYQVEYFPKINVFAKLTISDATVTEANYSWRIEAEQV